MSEGPLCSQELDELVRQAVRNIGYNNDDADTLTRYPGLLHCLPLPILIHAKPNQGRAGQAVSCAGGELCRPHPAGS